MGGGYGSALAAVTHIVETSQTMPRLRRRSAACGAGAGSDYCCLGGVAGWPPVVVLSGGEPGVELGGEACIESVELGGVAASEDDGVLGGGALDCIELSELGGADVSGPVACCREQAAASVSALRLKINKLRFIEHLAIVMNVSRPLYELGVSK